MWGAIIQMLIGAMGDQQAGKLSAQQLDQFKQQLADIAGIPVPELERITAQQLGPSAMEGIQRDERLRGDQLSSLEALKDIANNGGMSLSDRVGFEQAQGENDAADNRRRQGILSNMAQRGQADSGAALVAQLSSAQDAANRGRAAGQQFAARGEDRRLAALKDIAAGAGNLREQDFGEAKAKAAAQDAINQWNAGAREKANYYNAGLGQQDFTNRLSKATHNAGPLNNLASYYGNEAQGTRNQYAGYGKAAGNTWDKYASSWGGNSSGNNDSAGLDSEDAEVNQNDDDWGGE